MIASVGWLATATQQRFSSVGLAAQSIPITPAGPNHGEI